MKNILFTFLLLSIGLTLSAQDFVYKPRNPSFGGDTFNYNWLLSSAQAQDLTEDTRSRDRDSDNDLDDFTSSLNRQLLSQLSRQLVSAQFGDSKLEDGTYDLGNFQIDVSSSLDGLVITILDTTVGEQTEIVVPFY